jgi:tRNA(Ile)-lysidine synthase
MPRSAKPIDAITGALSRWIAALEPNSRLCVAYSGGVDSSVLLHALVRARASDAAFAELHLSAIHIHHGLSANADAWAAHCDAIAKSYGIECSVVRVKVDGTKETGIEAAARYARYAALLEHAARNRSTILLAHHARDQAETVLLQLLRGAGPAGLAAMPESSSPFARPLLHVEKAEIDAYAQQFSVAHIVDESNADNRFARNRLRNAVWPTLAGAFASAERTLARAAQWQQESDELANELAQLDALRCTDGETIIVNAWRELSSARRRNVLRRWLAKRGIATPSSERLVEWEKQLLTRNETQNVLLTHASFTGSIRLYRDRIYYVAPTSAEQGALSVGVHWNGEALISFGEGAVHFRTVVDRETEDSRIYVRPIASGESWVIRSRRDGDTIVLSPNSGGVSLKNVFQNADVAPWARAQWPILTCNGVVAALPGLVVAGEFRPDDGEACIETQWQPQRATNV